MPWATFLLAVICIYVAAKLFRLTSRKGRLKFLGLTLATSILAIMQCFQLIDFTVDNADFTAAAEFVVEWGHITCLAFVLSSLAVFIRESKPVFAQFPMLYTALPLLIVISYILVQDTYALKTWLIAIYQGGAIIVSLLMYAVYTYRNNDFAIILVGVCVFLMCYMLFWYIPGIQESYGWIWKKLVGAAMITTVIGYEQIETRKEIST
jgi:hypothetical protein